MPSLDLMDEMRNVRDELIKKVDRHAGKSGASLLREEVTNRFDELLEFCDDERREWEKVLNFLMDKGWDD